MNQIKQLFYTAFMNSTDEVPLGVMFSSRNRNDKDDIHFQVVMHEKCEVVDLDSITMVHTIKLYIDGYESSDQYIKEVETPYNDISPLIDAAMNTLGFFPEDEVATRVEIVGDPQFHYWVDFETGTDNFPRVQFAPDSVVVHDDQEVPIPLTRVEAKKKLRNKKTEKNNKVPRKNVARKWTWMLEIHNDFSLARISS